MEDLKDTKSLKNVGMSTVNDFPIEADYNFFKFCGISKFLIYFLSFILIFLCLFLAKPTTLIRKIQEIPFIDDKYQADFTIDDISPLNRLLHISCFFNNVKKDNLTFKTEMTLTATNDEQLAFSLADINNETTLNVIENNETELYHIFSDNKLNYDLLSLQLSFESKDDMPKNVTLLIEKGNSVYSLEVICIRCVLALIFAVPFALSLKDFIKGNMMIEQSLTLAVLSLCMVYVDPISALNLYYPMSFNHVRVLFVNNTCISLFIFYILTMYELIGLEPGAEKLTKLSIPYIFCLIYFVIGMSVDTSFNNSRVFGNTINLDYDYHLTAMSHFVGFSAFFVFYLILAIKKIILTQGIDKQRAINYTIISFPFLLGLEIFFLISSFTFMIRDTSFEEIVPLALFSGCLLLYKSIFRNVKKTDRGLYTKPESSKENDDNQLGVEAENVPALLPASDSSDGADQNDPLPSNKVD